MEHFGKFGVIYYDINQIITTAVMTLSKHFDTHGRIKEVQYEIFRSLMYWMTVQYDSMGRVVKRELKIGPYANTTQYRYDYDGDGQLSGVKVNTLCGKSGILATVLSLEPEFSTILNLIPELQSVADSDILVSGTSYSSNRENLVIVHLQVSLFYPGE